MGSQNWAVANKSDGKIIETSTARGGFLTRAIFGVEKEAHAFLLKFMKHEPNHAALEVVKVGIFPVVRRGYEPGKGLPWNGGMG